jgi:WD40 repeat protein
VWQIYRIIKSCCPCRQVWDIETLECIDTLKGHTGPVRTLVYSGGRMFSGSYDKTVRVWDVTTLKCLATLQGVVTWLQIAECCQGNEWFHLAD